MTQLPPNAILRAALRWCEQLQHSNMERARSVFSVTPGYDDLTMTQYSSGLDWLREIGLVDNNGGWLPLGETGTSGSLAEVLLSAAIENARLPWMRDADLLVDSVDDLPADLIRITRELELSLENGLQVVRSVWGKVDTEYREEFGRDGEVALVRLLRSSTGVDVDYIAGIADGFGYDIVVRATSFRLNLEVKSTSRRGRLSFFCRVTNMRLC